MLSVDPAWWRNQTVLSAIATPNMTKESFSLFPSVRIMTIRKSTNNKLIMKRFLPMQISASNLPDRE
jgi:hypothetical protein